MLENISDRKKWFFILISAAILGGILLVLASNNLRTHDGDEYVTFTKYLSGIDNIKVFWIHSAIFPLISAFFLKIYPSFKLVQLCGLFIIAVIGIMIWRFTKSRMAVILWSFSPIVWLLAGSIYPTILGTLFFFWSYVLFKKYEGSSKLLLLGFSGFMFGLSNAITESVWPYSLFFILVFFFSKRLKDTLFFIATALSGFAIKLIADYFVFGYAHFSILRFIGANALVFLNKHPENIIYQYSLANVLLILLGVSPLLFLAYRGYKSPLKRETIFVLLSLIFMLFIYTTGTPHHFFCITPIAVILLSKVLTRKEAMISILVSIPFIIYLVLFSSWNILEKYPVYNDFQQIEKYIGQGMVIADRNLELPLAAVMWSNKLRVIWLDEYNASKTGNPIIKTYEFEEKPGDNFKIAKISFSYLANADKEYPDNLPLIAWKDRGPPLRDYKAEKCYELICIFTKSV